MASSLSNLKTPLYFQCFRNPFSFRSSSRFIPSLSNKPWLFHSSFSSLKAASGSADNFLQKPVPSQGKGITQEQSSCYDEQEEQNHSTQEEVKWIDWEDRILEDTVPLVGFVRMILHSGMYENGDRINSEHEKTIVEKLLQYHPNSDKKIGCGIDYITPIPRVSLPFN